MSKLNHSINKLFAIFFLISLVKLIYCANDKIVENFNTFSEVLEDKFAESPDASETRPGIHLLNSFGVGYTLANLYQGLWNISVVGIPSVLKTVEKYIPDDYGHLLRLFKKNKFQITSTIYSRYGNITGQSPSFSMLMTHLITTDYVNNPAKFVDSFSSLIESGTKGHLDNELLPKGLWQAVFDNNTQGAYINTMHFKAKHPVPWINVGEKSFNSDSSVPFLETEGEFPFFVNDNVSIVILDIQQIPPKQIILAKHNLPMTIPQLKREVGQILESIQKPSKSSTPFVLAKLRVQIPAIRVTNLARHHLGLTSMGVDETFCNRNGSTSIPQFVQQPITQANYFEFASNYLEFSSATGSVVTLNTGDLDVDLDEEYDDDDIDSILVHDDKDDDEFEFRRSGSLFRAALKFDPNSHRTKTAVTSALLRRLKLQPPASPDSYSASPLKYQFQKRGRRNLNHGRAEEQKVKLPGNLLKQQCKKPAEIFEHVKVAGRVTDKFGDGKGINTLIFDSPFAFILRDEVLGETFSGYVESLCDYDTVMNSLKTSSIHAWLHDVFKVAFWKCY